MDTWRPNAAAVEQLIEYEFRDRSLLNRALDTGGPGFGALESLGDSINDLAVTCAVIAAGLPHQHAPRYTANDHLVGVAAASVGPFARIPHTGDTVESVIGAIHLDGGYELAARIGVRLCIPHAGKPTLDLAAVTEKELAWIGRQAIDAFVTDREIRRVRPNWPSQQDLHRIRSASQLREDSTDSAPYADRMAATTRAIGTAMATAGWDDARDECVRRLS